jgi:hypothetical protein
MWLRCPKNQKVFREVTVLTEAGIIYLLVRSDDAAPSLYAEVKKAHKFS